MNSWLTRVTRGAFTLGAVGLCAVSLQMSNANPALAAPTAVATASPPIKVQWNVVTAVANIAVYADYKPGATFGQNNTTAAAIVSGGNAAGTNCTATSPTIPSGVNQLVDFGNVTAPALAAVATACQYINAVNVQVQSNDSAGFAVTEQLSAALPAGTAICAVANTGAFPLTPVLNNATASAGTAVAQTSTTCGAGSTALTTAAFTMGSTATLTATGTNYLDIPEDLELVLNNTAVAVVGQQATLNFTLLIN